MAAVGDLAGSAATEKSNVPEDTKKSPTLKQCSFFCVRWRTPFGTESLFGALCPKRIAHRTTIER